MPRTGFSLSFAGGGALAVLQGARVADLCDIERLELEIPGVTFPIDLSGGASQFRHKRCVLRAATLKITEGPFEDYLASRNPARFGIHSLHAHFDRSVALLSGRISVGDDTASFTVRATALPDERGERIDVVAHDVRLYGWVPIPAPMVGATLLRMIIGDLLRNDDSIPAMTGGIEPIRPILLEALPPLGWKIPDLHALRIAGIDVQGGAMRVRWSMQEGGGSEAVVDDGAAPAQAFRHAARTLADAERRLQQGDLAGATDEYRAWARAEAADSPLGRFARLRLVTVLAADPRTFAEARTLCLEELDREPDQIAARASLAAIALKQGELEQAAEALKRITEVAEACGDEEDAVVVHTLLGEVLASAEPERALEHVESALRLRRRHAPALEVARRLYAGRGEWKRYVGVARRLVLANKERDRVETLSRLVDLGHVLATRLSEPERAREQFERALRLDPDNIEALAGLADTFVATGDSTRALRALERALVQEGMPAGRRADLQRRAAQILFREMDDRVAAEERLHDALNGAPGDPATLSLLAEVEGAGGHWDSAAAHYEEALRVWGISHDGHGESSAMEETLRDLDDPEAVSATEVGLARIYLEHLDEPHEAEEHLRAVVNRSPTHVVACDLLAGLLEGQQRWEAAAEVLERRIAVEADPALAATLSLRAGELWARVGLGERAAEAFARAAGAGAAPEAFRAEVALHHSREDWPRLRDTYSRMLEAADTPEERVEVAVSLAALQQEKLGDPGGALTWLRRAIHEAPGHLPALERLAHLLRFLNERDELASVLPELAAALVASGDKERAAERWLELSGLLTEIDAPASARIEALQQARVLGRERDALSPLAEVLRSEGRYADAREALERFAAIAADENAPPEERAAIHWRLARLALLQEDMELEAEHLSAARASAGGYVELLERLAGRYEEQAAWREVAEIREQLAALRNDSRSRLIDLVAAASVRADHLADLPAAAEDLEAALDLEPNDPPALMLALRVFPDAERWEDLAEVLARLASLAREPEDRADRLFQRAVLLAERLGRRADALRTLDSAVAAWPDHVDALTLLGRLLVEEGLWERAAQALGRLWAALPGRFSPAFRARLSLTRAQVARHLGSFDDAVEHLRVAIELDDSLVEALSELERLLRARAEWAELRKVLLRRLTLEKEPDGRVVLLRELAELEERELSLPEEAVAHWTELRALIPDEPEAPLRLAELHRQGHRLAQAVDALHEGAAVLLRAGGASAGPRAAQALMQASELSEGALRDPIRAAALLRDALSAGPEPQMREQIFARLESLAERSGDSRGRLEAVDLRLARASSDVERAELLVRRAAIVGLELEDPGPAAASLRPVLDDDSLPAAVKVRAMALATRLAEERGQLEEAARWYERLADLHTQEGEARLALEQLRSLARLLREQLGDSDAAAAVLRRVQELDPTSVEAAESLAQIALGNGDVAEAIRWFEEALAVADAQGEVDSAIRSLVELSALAEQQLGDLSSAARRLAGAVQRRPTDAALVRELARLREDLQDWEGAADARYALAALESEPADRATALQRTAELRHTFLADPEGAAIAFAQAAAAWQELGDTTREAASLEGLATAQRLRGRLRGAADAWSQRVSLAREHPGLSTPAEEQAALSALADALVELGSWHQAAEALRRLQRAGVTTAEDRLIRVLSAAGEWRALAEVLEARAGRAGEAGDREGEVTLRQQTGEIWAFFVGDLDRGLRHLERAWELSPREPRAARALLDVLRRAQLWQQVHELAGQIGDVRAAAHALERLYDAQPSGTAAIRAGRGWIGEDDARAEYWLARALTGSTPAERAEALETLAALHQRSERFDEELRLLAARIEIPDAEAQAPPGAAVLSRLVHLAFEAQNVEVLEAALQRLRHAPDATPAERLEAAAQIAARLRSTEPADAIALLRDEASRVDAPTNGAATLLARAGAWAEEIEEDALAQELFDQAERRSLGAALRIEAFRRYFARRGEWARLEEAAVEEAGKDPVRIAAALVRLGRLAQEEAGDLERARELLLRAVSLHPDDPVARETAAAVLADLGDADTLGELYGVAIERATNAGERAEALLAYGEALLRYAGDARTARRVLDDAVQAATEAGAASLAAQALGLCGEATARGGADREAAALLENAAASEDLDAATRARWLAMAADCTRRAGDLENAMRLAEAAAAQAVGVEGEEAHRLATQAAVAIARAQGDADRALALLQQRLAGLGTDDELAERGGAALAEAVALAVSAGDTALHDLHDWRQASASYRRALKLLPSSEWAVRGLIDALSLPKAKPGTSDWEEVVELLESAATMSPPGMPRVDLRRQQALLLAEKLGREDDARQLLRATAEELASGGVSASVAQRRERAELLMTATDYELALEILTALAAEPDADIDNRYREAECLVRMGRLETALQRYQALYAAGHRRAASSLALVYRRLGRERERVEVLLHEADAFIADADVYQATSLLAYAANALDALGQGERAVEALERAAALTARDDVVESLVIHYRAEGRFEELLRLYERTLSDLAPDQRGLRLCDMARVAADDLGRTEEAARLYTEALEADPLCPPALAWEGEREAAAQHWESAREKLERALAHKQLLGVDGERIIELRLLLGRAQLATGSVESARRTLDKVLGAAPEHMGAIDTRIELCRENDETAVLVEMLLRRRELRDPQDPAASAADLQEVRQAIAAGGVPEYLVVRAAMIGLREAPSDPDAMSEAFSVAQRTGKWDELDETLQELLLAHPSWWQLLVARVNVVAAGLEDGPEAERLLRAALCEPERWDDPMPIRDRLWELVAAGGDEAALAGFLDDALADEAYSASRASILWTAGADLARRRGDPKRELESLRQAISSAVSPEERAELRERLARRLVRTGGDELEAAALLVEAFREAPNAVPEALRTAREIYFRTGDLGRVVELLADEADYAGPEARGILLLERARILDETLGDRAGAMAALSAAIALDPDDAGAHRKLGFMRQEAGDLEQAVRSLKIASRADPRDKEIWGALARAYESMERMDEQADALLAYVQVDPSDDRTARELELILAQLGRWDDVASMLQFRAANALSPTAAARSLWRRALVLRDRLERPAEAYVALREAYRLDSGVRDILVAYRRMSMERAEWRVVEELLRAEYAMSGDLLERARLSVLRGEILRERLLNLRGAMQANKDALMLDPDRVGPGRSALEAVAELGEKLGDWEAASRALAELLERAANNDERASLALRTGRAREKLGDAAGAAEAYRVAARCPGTDEAVAAMAALRRGTEAASPAERIEMLRQLLQFEEDEEDRAGLMRELARAHQDGGDMETAGSVYERLLSTMPTDEEAFDFLRGSLVQRGMWGELSRLYDRRGSVTADVSERAAYAYESGRVLMDKMRREEEGLKAFRRALSFDPDYLPAMEALAELYYQRQDWRNADEMLRRLSGRSARYGSYEYLCRRAEVADALKRRDEAIRLYRSAFDANPSDLSVAEALAALYAQVGDLRGQEEMLNQLLSHLRVDFDRDRLAEVHAALADVRASQGAFEEARRHLRAVLEFEPERLDTLATLAELNVKIGRYEEATQDYLRLAPRVRDRARRQEFLLRVAEIFGREMHDEERELDVLLRAYDEDPSNQDVAGCLLEAYHRHGEWQTLGELAREVLSVLEEDLTPATAFYVAEGLRRGDRPALAQAFALLTDAVNGLLVDNSAGALGSAAAAALQELSGELGEEGVAEALSPRAPEAREPSSPHLMIGAEDITASQQVLRADPMKHLERSGRLDGERALAHVAVARYCLGVDAAPELRAGAFPLLPTVTDLTAPELEHEMASGPAADLIRVAAPLLDGLFEAEPPAGEDLMGSLAAQVVDLRTRLDMRAVLVRVLPEPGLALLARATTPPAITLGLDVPDMPTHERVFLLGRALASIRSGAALLMHLDPGEARELLLYICRAMAPSTTIVDEAGLGEGIGAQVEAMIAMANETAFERIAEAVERFMDISPDLDMQDWIAGMMFSADRVGLVACGDLAAALTALARIEGWTREDPLVTAETRAEVLAESEAMRELVKWATGEELMLEDPDDSGERTDAG